MAGARQIPFKVCHDVLSSICEPDLWRCFLSNFVSLWTLQTLLGNMDNDAAEGILKMPSKSFSSFLPQLFLHDIASLVPPIPQQSSEHPEA